MSSSGLRPCQRHITTHDAAGKSVYHKPVAQEYWAVPGTGHVARSYSVANVPAVLDDDADLHAYLAPPESSVTSHERREVVLPMEDGKNNGANLLIIDLKPGGTSRMHQTVSIDFSICVMGEIVHELDGGEKVTLLPGDHIVQRGTNHRWINASKEHPARAIAVTLPCIPFDIAGKKLEQIYYEDKEPAKI